MTESRGQQIHGTDNRATNTTVTPALSLNETDPPKRRRSTLTIQKPHGTVSPKGREGPGTQLCSELPLPGEHNTGGALGMLHPTHGADSGCRILPSTQWCPSAVCPRGHVPQPQGLTCCCLLPTPRKSLAFAIVSCSCCLSKYYQ